jgi:uncharacterized protein (TIGR02246 family)
MHALTDRAATDAAELATRVVAQLEDAWNRADGAGFAQPFTDDADFVDIRGDHHRGRVAIGHGHQAIFDSIYAGSTVRFELDGARQVAPGVVVAVASSTMDAPTGSLQGINHARFTLTLVEQDAGWEVAALHNTLQPSKSAPSGPQAGASMVTT